MVREEGQGEGREREERRGWEGEGGRRKRCNNSCTVSNLNSFVLDVVRLQSCIL